MPGEMMNYDMRGPRYTSQGGLSGYWQKFSWARKVIQPKFSTKLQGTGVLKSLGMYTRPVMLGNVAGNKKDKQKQKKSCSHCPILT